jgi:hypothetical protein
MPKNLTLCLFTLLLAFGSLAPGSTSAEPPAVGRDGKHHRVIQLTGVSVIAETIDLGEPGLSVGDSIVISDDLFQDGEKVGVHGGTCTVVRVETVLFHCVVTFALPDGHITAQGLVRPELAEEQVAVTGGTGTYTTAQGELTVLEEGEGQSRYTFDLLLSTSK